LNWFACATDRRTMSRLYSSVVAAICDRFPIERQYSRILARELRKFLCNMPPVARPQREQTPLQNRRSRSLLSFVKQICFERDCTTN
jgi:hypothetical protein